ncbi:MAG: tRNA pseudouridine(38-40) synthase TruA [Natronospirillum sp.]
MSEHLTEVFAPDHADHHQRIALGVEYMGTQYSGWQSQSGSARTVQDTLEAALSKVAAHPVRLFCAGRTDAGVHATGQVAHFDTSADRSPYGWTLGANSNLPNDISVQWIKPMPQTFHARFMAQARRYRYVIYNHPIPSAVLRNGMTWEKRPLSVTRMQAAANSFVGEHDFTSFRAAACQAHSPVKTIYHCRVIRQGRLVIIDVRANAFLHHMVRNIAGVLLSIGSGEAAVEWAGEVLAGRSRQDGGVTARPDGLYFVRAEYAKEFELPEPSVGPAFLGEHLW